MVVYHVSSQKTSGDELVPKEKPNLEKYEPFMNSIEKDFDEFVKYYYSDYVQKYIDKDTARRPSKWACEAIFESVRLNSYSSRPSRLNSVYLCDDLQSAKRFRSAYRSENSNIFQASIPDNCCEYFDMTIFTKAEEFLNKSYLDRNIIIEVTHIARSYWEGCRNDCPNRELLYDGTIILEKLSRTRINHTIKVAKVNF